jgi:hypothetical protein
MFSTLPGTQSVVYQSLGSKECVLITLANITRVFNIQFHACIWDGQALYQEVPAHQVLIIMPI